MLEYVSRNRTGFASLLAAVFGQFLLELTLGRHLPAPNLICIVLVYLMVNRGAFWSVDGAFWAGLVLDGLLRQPLGASSLALILALQTGRAILSSLSSDNRVVFFLTIGVISLIADVSGLILVSRPFLSSFSLRWLAVLPRSVLTMGVVATWAALAGGIGRRWRESPG